MWRIKRRRTKPQENKAKTGVIYPKFNATSKPTRYVNRNTYLDVKSKKDKCTIVGCQCTVTRLPSFSVFISGAKGNNTLIYSKDGINWTGLGKTVFGGFVNSVKWNGEIWTAVGGYNNTVGYSYDGLNWVGVGDPFGSGPTHFGIDIASNGSEWMAISTNGTIIKSINGIVWTPTVTKPPITFSPFGIAYGGGKWLVFGDGPNQIYYSQDNGNTWTVSGSTTFPLYANRGFYNGSLWVAGGASAPSNIFSSDGIIWKFTAGSIGLSNTRDVFYNGSIWVAGGVGTTASIVWSNDGKNWTDATNKLLVAVNGVTWNSSINLWVATSGGSADTYNIIYSQDGKTWTGVPKNPTLMNSGSANYLFSGIMTPPTTVSCCKTTPYRNPILGYRKYLADCSGNNNVSVCGYTNDVSGNVYKDNYAKSCAINQLACYNPVIKRKQNQNGFVNESYNYSTNQLLTRRCLTFPQQEFNFQSQVPVDGNTKFKSCANCQYKTNGCDCSANGFCLAVNKLPCEVKNTKCYAVYKRSNGKFNRQGAVSGGSRINRLKYQTQLVSQSRRVNGRNNVINRVEPAALYTTSRPMTLRDTICTNIPPPPTGLFAFLEPFTIVFKWETVDMSKLCRIAPLTGFTIQRTGSNFGHAAIVGPAERSYTYSNLTVGLYSLRIRSDSFYGSSDWVYLNNVKIGTPNAPVLVSATSGDTKVTLVWTEPSDTWGVPITDYEWTTDSWVTWVSFGNASLTGEITGLANGTPYTFEVRAVNAQGTGLSSNSLPSTPSTTPSAPGLTSATPLVNSAPPPPYPKVMLAWTVPSDTGGSPITGYEWTTTTSIGWQSFVGLALSGEVQIVIPPPITTSFTFKVRAKNIKGPGSVSNTRTIPGAPVLNSATSGDTQVTLAWATPSDTGSLSITDYEWRKNSGLWDPLGSTALTRVVSGLINGDPYTFEVRAQNSDGDGFTSNSLTATPSTTPGAPVLNSATHGDIKVTLVWAEPLDTGGSPITDYEWTDNSGASWDAFGSTALTGVITGLTNGTSYTFKVRAVNANGVGLLSSNSLTATPSTTPSAPVLNSATPSNTQVTLVWAEPLDTGGLTINDYEWTDNSGATWTSFGNTALTGIITGLAKGTSYTFEVRANNVNGGGTNSNSLTATIPSTIPGAPVFNSATPGDRRITLTWAEPLDTGGSPIIEYHVILVGATGWSSVGSGLTIAWVDLSNGTPYTFKVRAVNANGIGSESDPITATPTA
jgi:hypothetical protein